MNTASKADFDIIVCRFGWQIQGFPYQFFGILKISLPECAGHIESKGRQVRNRTAELGEIKIRIGNFSVLGIDVSERQRQSMLSSELLGKQ